MVIDVNGPPCQGTCPNHGCIESVASGTAIGAGGAAHRRARGPESGAGPRPRGGAQLTGRSSPSWRTTATRSRRMVIGLIGRKLGVGLSSISNIFNPDYIVVGGGAMAPASCCWDRPHGAGGARRCAPPATWCQGRRGEVRRRGRHARARPCWRSTSWTPRAAGRDGLRHHDALMAGSLVVCPTPIGNLEDVTLRAAARAARGRPHRLRGHPPHAPLLDRYGIEPARWSAITSTTSAGGRRLLVAKMRARRRGRAGLRRGHAARVRPWPDRRRQPASRPGCRSRCCPVRRRW